MRALALMLPLMLLQACAGPVDPNFAGTWTGTSTVDFEVDQPVAYAAQIDAELLDEGAALAHVCPGGDGRILFLDDNGSPGTATWQGQLVCAPVALNGCDSVQFTYSLGWANLTRRMAVRLSGDATGCGKSGALSLLFDGAK